MAAVTAVASNKVFEERYKKVFDERTDTEFKKDAEVLKRIFNGDRLGWDENFRPERYASSTRDLSRWLWSWDPKRESKGLQSSEIAIAWARAYKDKLGVSQIINGKFLVLATSYQYLVGRLNCQNLDSSEKIIIVSNFEKAAEIILDKENKQETASEEIK